jgi:hypothetical protein
MQYLIKPQKDASIYLASSSMNAGLDEILEISKTIESSGSSPTLARTLVKFDLSTLYTGSSVSGSRRFLLKMYATSPENLQLNYTLQVNPVSQSWSMGRGKFFNTPISTDGVSWDYKTSEQVGDYWFPGSSSLYGGTWFANAGQTVTQSYAYQSADINIDVSSIVEQWLNNTIVNEGFILKYLGSQETDTTEYGTLKFFSADTNTVYKPKLIVQWNDSTYTGLNPSGTLNANDSSIYIKSIRPTYNINSIEKVVVVGRDRYPQKTFSVTGSQYLSFNYLPSQSYYAVKDAYTGEYIIPYDNNYTKISCDSSGNYFNFNFGLLNENRLYKFELKVVRGLLVQYFNSNELFKVTE